MREYGQLILDAITAFQSQYVSPTVDATAIIDSHGMTIAVTELQSGEIGRSFRIEITSEEGEQLQFFEELSENYFRRP